MILFLSRLVMHLALLFPRARKSREQRGPLLFYVIFTVGGSGLMTAQQMLYAMLVSMVLLGTYCQHTLCLLIGVDLKYIFYMQNYDSRYFIPSWV